MRSQLALVDSWCSVSSLTSNIHGADKTLGIEFSLGLCLTLFCLLFAISALAGQVLLHSRLFGQCLALYPGDKGMRGV